MDECTRLVIDLRAWDVDGLGNSITALGSVGQVYNHATGQMIPVVNSSPDLPGPSVMTDIDGWCIGTEDSNGLGCSLAGSWPYPSGGLYIRGNGSEPIPDPPVPPNWSLYNWGGYMFCYGVGGGDSIICAVGQRNDGESIPYGSPNVFGLFGYMGYGGIRTVTADPAGWAQVMCGGGVASVQGTGGSDSTTYAQPIGQVFGSWEVDGFYELKMWGCGGVAARPLRQTGRTDGLVGAPRQHRTPVRQLSGMR